jgi:hypothetical protein
MSYPSNKMLQTDTTQHAMNVSLTNAQLPQMLRQSKSISTMLAGNNTLLCSKNGAVVGKLNDLANKVSEELKSLNETNAAKLEAKNAAAQARARSATIAVYSAPPPPL